jgi:N-acetylglucosamine-6-phosphate deacetylase
VGNLSYINVIEGRRVDTGEKVHLTIDGDRIRAMETIDNANTPTKRDELWIAPGLVDLQINGYGGSDVNLFGVSMELRVQTLKKLVRQVLSSGTTTFCPTIITAGYTQTLDSMTAIRLACEQDPLSAQTIAGIHLEGPYISGEDGPRGAHPKEHARNPDFDEFRKWQEASGDRISLVTLAPEREGAIPFVRKLTEAGVLVCIGHTAAAHEDIAAAVEAGARMSTHLGNGAHPQLPRHPNYIWSQLAEDRLFASVICDGHHLHPSVVNVMSKVKRDQLVLVSDAVHLAGMAPGRYASHVGGDVELLPSGRLQMASNPLLLAGAAVSLADCVERYVRFTGAPLAEAFRLAAKIPAQLLGLKETGNLQTGSIADLLVFAWNEEDKQMSVQTVIKNGQQFESEQVSI